MLGIQGVSLVNNSVASGCIRCSAPAVAAYLEQGTSDIDGNGQIDALTDGLLAIRYIFNIRDEVLITKSIGDACQRCTAIDIQDYLETLIGTQPNF